MIWNMEKRASRLAASATIPDPEVHAKASSTYGRDTIIQRLQAIRDDTSGKADAERAFLRRTMARKGWA